MSTVRICMLTTFYPPYNFGGDGIGVQRLAQAFGRRGIEVTVIHDVDAFNALHDGPEPDRLPASDNVRAVGLRSGIGALSPLLTHQTGRPIVNGGRIRSILEDGDFDITIFNNMSLVGGPGALRDGRGISIYEAHEHWLVCPMHVLWRHNREPCTGRECLRCTLRFHRPPQLWRYTGMLERSTREVDAFIAKSEFSRRKHAEFGFEHEMSVIPYFLPDTPGPAAPAGRERPYFLFVGRLERIKGLDDVIPAFRTYPEADLVIAGDGEHGEPLRQLAGGAPNIHFLGRVPLEELRSLYRSAIALIVPSTGFETFGIILIEALRRMQEDSGLRERLGRNARAAYETNWTEDAVVPRYFELFANISDRTGSWDIMERLDAEGVA
jgi:glycosyltransferase involved in cell wall biosynthesis